MNKLEFNRIAILETPVGKLKILSNEVSLIGCKWISEDNEISMASEELSLGKENNILDNLKVQLQEYFDNKRDFFSLPFKFKGTEFQEKVWNEICRIPYGNTISYAEIAQKIGKPTAVRAVANACGRNPLAVLVPCHRVVGSGTYLGGYTGGIEKKIYLLSLEKGGKPLMSDSYV